jgi:hypothetical protein
MHPPFKPRLENDSIGIEDTDKEFRRIIPIA